MMIRFLLLVLFFLLNLKSSGQDTDVTISFETPIQARLYPYEGQKSVSAFIMRGIFSTEETSVQCETMYGEFKFRVNHQGQVDSLLVLGNLRPYTINKICKGIRETSGHWKGLDQDRFQPFRWFTFPFYSFTVTDEAACEKAWPSHENFKRSLSLLQQLPYTDQGLLRTKDGYLIQPGYTYPMDKK